MGILREGNWEKKITLNIISHVRVYTRTFINIYTCNIYVYKYIGTRVSRGVSTPLSDSRRDACCAFRRISYNISNKIRFDLIDKIIAIWICFGNVESMRNINLLRTRRYVILSLTLIVFQTDRHRRKW